MKSKFFGLSAKLALAILAVGTTLTSCYDSENGDVVKPYVPEAPKYVVSGYVTDFVTGEPISGASVSVAGVASATTGSTGEYTVTVTSPVNGTVTISATDYIAVSRTLSMETISTGMASYTVDAALIKEGELPGVKVTVLEAQQDNKNFSAAENVAVDLVNDTDEPIERSLTFVNLTSGIKYSSSVVETRAENSAKEAFEKYCQVNFGVTPSDKFATNATKTFTFSIPAFSSVYAVNLRTYWVKEEYTFPYDGAEASFVVERIVGHAAIPDIKDNSHYHGHGHGHGHGGSLNAGGGIFE